MSYELAFTYDYGRINITLVLASPMLLFMIYYCSCLIRMTRQDYGLLNR